MRFTNNIRSSSAVQLNFILLMVCLLFSPQLEAQKRKKNKQKVITSTSMNAKVYDAIEWRNLGPWRGGRSCAVAGVPGKPNLYYFGATGGGVWKTTDGGRQWENISDGFFGGSIGAIEVSQSDPNVIYVGGGEVTVRGNVSSGSGMWKSVDAGKTWKHIGLEKSRHVARVRIHPTNSDIVYAAVMGNLYTGNKERGLYKSTDGGKNWRKVLFINNEVGMVDLTFDPNNPRILFASSWRVKRTPYDMSSGGEGSALWNSTDGGETWTDISKNEGLPKGTWGISGITISPANSNRMWAIIEAKKGGVFRSEDGGKKWKMVNSERKLRQRAWYYTRIYADPKDEDLIYVLNVRYHKSKDGGKTFSSLSTPHSDHHDLWIAPEDPKRMVVADDGGAQVTYDGGETWSTYHNQPTGQFYRVTTDNHFPFRIYAAQQDNSTVRILNRTSGGSIGERDWESTAGCECGHIAIDPNNNDIVYGGCYDGFLERKDHKNDQSRTISVWPDNPMGHGAESMKYRFQWNFPLFFSQHNSKKLYTASNHLHVSYDEGNSWKTISPDLTRNDSTKLGSSGGPITKDNTSVEYYCTIFAATESIKNEQVIWTGSDDGLIHITEDGGKNWNNVTPSGMPEWMMINSMEADPFHEGGLYVAGTRYKLGDFQPYLYHTKDFGKTWKKIVRGIAPEHFTRVVRCDPEREGLLYTGTENGVYISFDNGGNWETFQLNIPIVPITDMTVKHNTLIAATQGRGIWMIDDLTPIHQMNSSIQNKSFHLFEPNTSFRMSGFQRSKPKNAGKNHPGGVSIYYYLKELTDSTKVSLSFYDLNDTLIRSYSTTAEKKSDQLKVKEGANHYVWNMRYPDAKRFEGMILWWGSMSGPLAVPGEYKVVMKVDGVEQSAAFNILKDPRSASGADDFKAQFDFVNAVVEKVSEAHDAIIDIRDVRKQLKHYQSRLKDKETYKDILELAEQIDSSMTVVEEALYQTKNRSSQDPLNFPIRLTNKLAHLNSLTSSGNFKPTVQATEVKDELTKMIDSQLDILKTILERDVPLFNERMRAAAVDAVILD